MWCWCRFPLPINLPPRNGLPLSSAATLTTIERPDLIIIAITSQIKPAQTVGEVIVQDWQGAGLLKPSAIKPVITTIKRSLIINKLGQLKEDDRAVLRRAIGQILG